MLNRKRCLAGLEEFRPVGRLEAVCDEDSFEAVDLFVNSRFFFGLRALFRPGPILVDQLLEDMRAE